MPCREEGKVKNFYQRGRVANGRHAILRGLLGNHRVNGVTRVVTPSSSHTRKCCEGVSLRDIAALRVFMRSCSGQRPKIRAGPRPTRTELNNGVSCGKHDDRASGRPRPPMGNAVREPAEQVCPACVDMQNQNKQCGQKNTT